MTKLRFSLRKIFLVLIIGAVVSFSVQRVREAINYAQIVRDVMSMDGLVRFSSCANASEPLNGPKQGLPCLLVWRCLTSNVEAVSFGGYHIEHGYQLGSKVEQELLACGEREAFFFTASVNDADMETISRLQGLEYLSLHRAQIGHTGIMSLSGLQDLQALDLSFTTLDDNDIRALETMKQLRWICLSGSRVTQDGARRLAIALPHCEVICSQYVSPAEF